MSTQGIIEQNVELRSELRKTKRELEKAERAKEATERDIQVYFFVMLVIAVIAGILGIFLMAECSQVNTLETINAGLRKAMS